MSSVTERTLQANGLAFNVAEAGSGPPVLLLHGFPDSWRLWRHQIPALAKAGHRVIAPDLRGFGKTERPAEVVDYELRALVNDVVGLLDVLDVDQAAVVGHDWGAALAWAVARFVPDRVSRLVAMSVGHLLAAAAGLAQRRLSWYMLWFLFPGVAERVLPEDDWAFFRRWAWNDARRGEDPDLDRQLADLSRPGALVAGLNWYRANNDPNASIRVSVMPVRPDIDGTRPSARFSRLHGGLVPVVIPPTFVAARRCAGLAGRSPRPPAAIPPARQGRHPAAVVGGPLGRGRRGAAGRAVVPARRPHGRDLQDRGRRQPGPAAWRAGRARLLPARRHLHHQPRRPWPVACGDGPLRRGGLRGRARDPGAATQGVGQPAGCCTTPSGTPTPPRACR